MTSSIIYQPGAKGIRGMGVSEDYSVYVAETPGIVTQGTTTPRTTNDAVFNRITSAVTINNARYQAVNANPRYPSCTWKSLNPDIASITPDGVVSGITNGVATFEVTGPFGKRRFTRTIALSAPSTVDVFSNYVIGSLARHIVDAMTSMVAGKSPSDSTLLNYSTFSGDYANPVVVRNQSNIAAGIDLSGMSVFRSEGQNNGYWPGCLVTKRHYVAANHVTGGGASSYCWMAPNGTFEKATPLSVYHVPNTDLHIGYLDRDVPTSIKRFKILPANYRNYLPSARSLWIPSLSKRMVVGNDGAPGSNTPKYDSMRILPVRLDTGPSNYFGDYTPYAIVPTAGNLDPSDPFRSWEVVLHNGDSSGPSWFLINGEPVLLGHYAEITGSPHLADHIAELETQMNTLAALNGDGTSYSFSKIDLSSFPTY